MTSSRKSESGIMSDLFLHQCGQTKFRQVKHYDRRGNLRNAAVIGQQQRDRVVAIPMTSQGRLMIVQDFFAGMDEKLYGGLHDYLSEDYQDLSEVARNICLEKMGIKARVVVSLGYFAPLPSTSNERVHLFLAFTQDQEINVSEAIGDGGLNYQIKTADPRAITNDDVGLSPGDTYELDGAAALAISRVSELVSGLPLDDDLGGAVMLGYLYANQRQRNDVADRMADDFHSGAPFPINSREASDFERGERIFARIQKAISEVATWN